MHLKSLWLLLLLLLLFDSNRIIFLVCIRILISYIALLDYLATLPLSIYLYVYIHSFVLLSSPSLCLSFHFHLFSMFLESFFFGLTDLFSKTNFVQGFSRLNFSGCTVVVALHFVLCRPFGLAAFSGFICFAFGLFRQSNWVSVAG